MGAVAWDTKKLVVTDRMEHGGAINLGTDQYLFLPEEGKDYWEIYGVKVLAFAMGTAPTSAPFVKERLQEGVTHHNSILTVNTGASQVGVFLVDENGLGWLWITDCDPRNPTAEISPINGPYACGNAEGVMFGVLSIGKCAETAIKTALKLDVTVHGKPVIWEYPGKPEKPSTRPDHLKPEVKESK